MGLDLAKQNGDLLLRQLLILLPQPPVSLELDVDKDQDQAQGAAQTQYGDSPPVQPHGHRRHGQENVQQFRPPLLLGEVFPAGRHHAPHQGQGRQGNGLGQPESRSPLAEVGRGDDIKQPRPLGQQRQGRPSPAQKGNGQAHPPPCPPLGQPGQQIQAVQQQQAIAGEILDQIAQPVPEKLGRAIPIPGPGVRPQKKQVEQEQYQEHPGVAAGPVAVEHQAAQKNQSQNDAKALQGNVDGRHRAPSFRPVVSPLS